jgi:hypothetical protein
MNQIGQDDLLQEYGPIDQKVRLAPPPETLKEIKEALGEKHAAEQALKKKKTKRKRQEDTKVSSKKQETANTATKTSVSAAAHAKVTAAVRSSKVLSSLFVSDSAKVVSEKEKKDHLFARTG